MTDLRKLIKYEERMGINTQQDNYFESLFKRTTASYRAKIDQENASRNQTKYDYEKPSTSKQATFAGTRRVLQERNARERDPKSSSSRNADYDNLESNTLQKSHIFEDNEENSLIDSMSIKVIIEKTLSQVLQEKFSQQASKSKSRANSPNEISSTSSKSLVEETINQVQKGLADFQKYSGESYKDAESLKTIIENVVSQVLEEKLSDMVKSGGGVSSELDNLNQGMQQKLRLSNDKTPDSQQVGIRNNINPLDSKALVNDLLGLEDQNDKNKSNKGVKSKSNKENSATSNAAGIKHSRRSPRKKPEWQDPGILDTALGNSRSSSKQRRTHSPTGSLNVRSARSKCSSSVMIPRSASQGRAQKPKSDPVALYQYYKKEWEHFRKQIPGETTHNRLRWHIRQRMLDPE